MAFSTSRFRAPCPAARCRTSSGIFPSVLFAAASGLLRPLLPSRTWRTSCCSPAPLQLPGTAGVLKVSPDPRGRLSPSWICLGELSLPLRSLPWLCSSQSSSGTGRSCGRSCLTTHSLVALRLQNGFGTGTDLDRSMALIWAHNLFRLQPDAPVFLDTKGLRGLTLETPLKHNDFR